MHVDKMPISMRGIAIEKLNKSNFYAWKQITHLVLTHRIIENFLAGQNRYDNNSPEHTKWIQCGKLAQAIDGLSLFDEMFDNVRGA